MVKKVVSWVQSLHCLDQGDALIVEEFERYKVVLVVKTALEHIIQRQFNSVFKGVVDE